MSPDAIYRVAAIPGDGVGTEVMAAGRRVLDCVAGQSNGRFCLEWTEFPWGCAYYAEHGRMMAQDGVVTLAHGHGARRAEAGGTARRYATDRRGAGGQVTLSCSRSMSNSSC